MRSLLFKEIERVYPAVVGLRRTIHRNPDLSGHEQPTAQFIFSHLKALKLSPAMAAGKTGVVCAITHGKGKTVALRADLDALPIEERTTLPYRSCKPGIMHACGHDMHTAILFGAAAVLSRLSHLWAGKIILLFQPSEEQEPGGAIRLIHEGHFPKNADAVLGLHVSIDHATGTIGLKPGNDFAGLLVFEVTVRGRGGHGAVPDKAIDPIVCTSAIIMELQTLISRECSPLEPAVLTVGTLHAGTKNNIIPDDATFSGNIRALSEPAQKHISRRLREICESTAQAFRCSAEVKFEKSYPAGYNNPELSARASGVLSGILGAKKVIAREKPAMFAEDFAYYQQRAPGLFGHLGVRNPVKKSNHGIHSSRFAPDEEAMKTGMLFHVALALDILKR